MSKEGKNLKRSKQKEAQQTAPAQRKWKVACGVLASFLAIAIIMCFLFSDGMGSYETKLPDSRDEQGVSLNGSLSDLRESYQTRLNDVWSNFLAAQKELGIAKRELTDVSLELLSARSQVVRLDEADYIEFGNGLTIIDVREAGRELQGKVQNVSGRLMNRAFVIVAVYDEDGIFKSVEMERIYDLHPEETREWTISGRDGAKYAIYTFGSNDEPAS